MAGTGIWLSDQDLNQTGGALWAQQQTQQLQARVSAGQQWAQDQIARLQQQAQAQVQAVAPPAPVAAPPPMPVPAPPVPAPPPSPLPAPPPVPAAAQAPIPSPPLETPPSTPPPVPPATPAPATPPTTDTTQTPTAPDLSGLPQAGQNWAQQQLQNLLKPPTSTQGPQTAPTATPAPSAAPTPPITPQATPAAPVPPVGTPGAPAGPQPNTPGDLIDQARQAAQAVGIDPDIFTRQIQQESGFQPTNADGSPKTSPAGAIGIAQIMPATAKAWGVDPTDPVASLAAAAKEDAQNLVKYGGSWAKTLAAYNAGGGNVDKYNGVPPFAETQSYVNTILGGAKDLVAQGVGAAQGAVQGAVQAGQQAVQNVKQAITGQSSDPGMGAPVNTPAQGQQAAAAVEPQRQFEQEAGLSTSDAYTACGPVAAAAFAKTYGRNPTASEAIALARQVGWDPSTGMAGPQSEVSLLNKMGVDAHVTQGVDWNAVQNSAQSGNPVILNTPNHYLYVDGYNAQTGQYHVGASGQVLVGGSDWMTPDQIANVPGTHGAANSAIFVDHPIDGTQPSTQVNRPAPSSSQPMYMGTMQPATDASQSVAGQSLIDQLLGQGQNAANTVGGAFSGLGSTAQNALGGAQNLLGQAGGTIQDKAQQVQDAVQNVGGAAATGVTQAPQTLNDLLTQNALMTAGVPTVAQGAQNLPSYLQGLVSPAQDVLGNALNSALGVPQSDQSDADARWAAAQQAAQQQTGSTVGLPSNPLDVLGNMSPYGIGQAGQQLTDWRNQLIAQGNPLRNVPGLGGLTTLLGQATIGDPTNLLLAGAPEAAVGRDLVPAVTEAAGGVASIPFGEATRALLAQGPATQAATPELLRAIDQAAQARALGVSPDVLSGTFDELGRRVPSGAIENPLTSAELGQPSYDQYGVFQRDPALYSQRGIAMDPATGQEIVPPQQGVLDWRTQVPSSAVLDGLKQMARDRGLDPDTPALSQRLQQLTDQVTASMGQPLGGAQLGQANAAFARMLGGAALGGGGTYLTTDPNDPNRWEKVGAGTLAGGLAAGPGLDFALHGSPSGISAGDWLSGLYRGGIVSAPSTMLDVAGQSTLSPILSTIAGLGRDALELSPGRIQGRLLGTTAGLGDWANRFLGALSPSQIAARNPNALIGRAAPGLERAAAYAAEGAGATHGAFQQATQNLIQSQELGALGGDIGWQQGLRGGQLQQFVQNFINNPPPDALTAAQGVGARVSGGQNLGTLSSWLGRAATGGGPISDALFPVYRKGMQLASRMVEMSPLGTAGTAIDVARGLLGQGPYAAGLGSTPANNAVGPLAERLANNAIGTGLAVLLAHQASEGNITGSWQGLSPEQQDVLRGQGQSPNSVQLFGGWRDWSKLPPALQGPLIAAGAYADAQHAATEASAKQMAAGPEAYAVQDPREAAAEELLREVGGQLINRTPLRTFADVYDAATGGGSPLGTPVDLASSMLGSLVPASAIVRTAAQATDPYERQILRPQIASQVLPAILQNLAQNVPGAREQLPTRLDVLGRDIQNPQQGVGAILPLHAAAGQPSPVLAAMAASGVAPSPVPDSIPLGPNLEIKLTPAQQQQYERYRGAILDQAAPDLPQGDPRGMKNALIRIDQLADTAARRMLLGDIANNAPGGNPVAYANATGKLAPIVPYGPSMSQSSVQQQQMLAQQQALMASLFNRVPAQSLAGAAAAQELAS